MYGHDPAGTRYSPLKQITPKNVSKLQLAWSYGTQAPVTQAAFPQLPAGAGREGAIPGAPGGRGRGDGGRGPRRAPIREHAAGDRRRHVPVHGLQPGARSRARNRQEALGIRRSAHARRARDRVLARRRGVTSADCFGTSDGWLISLNAKTGKLVPGFGNEGMVNLRLGVADKFFRNQYSMSSAPTIYKNLVITGSQVQESPSLAPPETSARGTCIRAN